MKQMVHLNCFLILTVEKLENKATDTLETGLEKRQDTSSSPTSDYRPSRTLTREMYSSLSNTAARKFIPSFVLNLYSIVHNS